MIKPSYKRVSFGLQFWRVWVYDDGVKVWCPVIGAAAESPHPWEHTSHSEPTSLRACISVQAHISESVHLSSSAHPRECASQSEPTSLRVCISVQAHVPESVHISLIPHPREHASQFEPMSLRACISVRAHVPESVHISLIPHTRERASQSEPISPRPYVSVHKLRGLSGNGMSLLKPQSLPPVLNFSNKSHLILA